MSDIEDILDEPIPKTEKRGRGRPKGSTKKSKEERVRVKEDKNLTEEELRELNRKKDILVSVAALGELEQYTGEKKMPPAQIRLLPKDRTEALFDVYQSKLGQEMTEESMATGVDLVVKAASMLVTFDDNEALKEDLMKNSQLRRMLGVKTAGVAEKYGDFVAWARVAFDFFRHIKFPDTGPSPNVIQQEALGFENLGFDPEAGLVKKEISLDSSEKKDL